jgi:hypothetical protein
MLTRIHRNGDPERRFGDDYAAAHNDSARRRAGRKRKNQRRDGAPDLLDLRARDLGALALLAFLRRRERVIEGEVPGITSERGGEPAALRLALGEREERPQPRIKAVALFYRGAGLCEAPCRHMFDARIEERPRSAPFMSAKTLPTTARSAAQ